VADLPSAEAANRHVFADLTDQALRVFNGAEASMVSGTLPGPPGRPGWLWLTMPSSATALANARKLSFLVTKSVQKLIDQ
jgi:hypothetical protein